MKQISRYNTEIGSVVGAIPPVMGYVAATGGPSSASAMAALLSPESALLGSLLFAWQVHPVVCVGFRILVTPGAARRALSLAWR